MVRFQVLRAVEQVRVLCHHQMDRCAQCCARVISEVQMAPAFPSPTLAARRGARVPRTPAVPSAVHPLAAPAWTAHYLLPIEGGAVLAAVSGIPLDVPESLHLPTALTACTPVLPVAVGTVDRSAMGHIACCPRALQHLGQGCVAAPAAPRRPQNAPAALVLAAAAAGGARAPLPPGAERAVPWRPAAASGRPPARARLRLLQGAHAPPAVAAPVCGHAPGPPFDAAAAGRAVTPRAPVRQPAVNGKLAGHVDVAKPRLPVLPDGLAAAAAGHARNLPRPGRGPAPARRRAGPPGLPRGPEAVPAPAAPAPLRVARGDLLLVPGEAGIPSAPRSLGDVPHARALPPVAGASAAAPVAPLAPAAVRPVARRAAHAGAGLAQGRLAPIALQAAEAVNISAAHLLTHSATCGACTPVAPRGELAILWMTWPSVAAPRLDQLERA
mmetsp:Transcript_107768/g.304870  ORF Transcript_107768/g.304870 Transcript_107768/m.304870 type:complete len:441 (+) Transcript_107768:320-1642(+)